MKVTTEKLPKSLVALDIELDADQVEKGLDRAARRLSQKYNVPGFRKGKAPRFIIENFFGRGALLEEATEDLVNKNFQAALEQSGVNPFGPANLAGISSTDPFTFRVTVPVAPTTTLGDYRNIRVPLEESDVTDETVQRALDVVRDKHVVLQELEEPRGAQQGDRLTVKMESIVDDEPLEERDENDDLRETTLDMEPGRLVDELYQGLLGATVGEERSISATMPEDHANEQVRGKEVTFNVQVIGIQGRLLPAWEELPTLENFEGTLDELREKTRKELEESARNVAERKVVDSYIELLVSSTEYDIPEVMVENLAHDMLHDQGRQFERYGISLDQMLEYRGKTHDQAVAELLPDAERQTRVTLALQQVVQREGFTVSDEEIEAEVERLLLDYSEDQRDNIRQVLSTQMRSNVANIVLDRKLRERLIAIATGTAPELPAQAEANPAPEAVEAQANAGE